LSDPTPKSQARQSSSITHKNVPKRTMKTRSKSDEEEEEEDVAQDSGNCNVNFFFFLKKKNFNNFNLLKEVLRKKHPIQNNCHQTTQDKKRKLSPDMIIIQKEEIQKIIKL
jgi:hypothetical protein